MLEQYNKVISSNHENRKCSFQKCLFSTSEKVEFFCKTLMMVVQIIIERNDNIQNAQIIQKRIQWISFTPWFYFLTLFLIILKRITYIKRTAE